MTEQQIIQTIARHEERLDHHDKRITRNEDLTLQIHKLASGVENLTGEVKGQNGRMEKLIVTFDGRMKAQGERLGKLENKGSKKLEGLVATIVTVLLTAVIMYFVGNIM